MRTTARLRSSEHSLHVMVDRVDLETYENGRDPVHSLLLRLVANALVFPRCSRPGTGGTQFQWWVPAVINDEDKR